MIEIKKGNNTLEVSKATYNSIFKRMGFEIVNKDGAKKTAPSKDILPKKNKVEKVEKDENKKDNSSSKDKSSNDNEKNDLDNILGIISNNTKND